MHHCALSQGLSSFFFRQGKGTDWTGVAQCKFKRPVVYGNFHMMIPSQQASWASYTPHILWLPFNMDISRKKRWELALNGSRWRGQLPIGRMGVLVFQ